MRILVKTSTGKIHAGSKSGRGTNCHDGNRAIKCRPAHIESVKAAHNSTFCSKCFVDEYAINQAREGICPQ